MDFFTLFRNFDVEPNDQSGKLLGPIAKFNVESSVVHLGKFEKQKAGDWAIISTFPVSAFYFTSDQIRKGFLHFTELAYAEPEEEGSDYDGGPEGYRVEFRFTTEDAPAKAINDAYHRIQRVK